MKTPRTWITSLAIALMALGVLAWFLSEGHPTLASPWLSPLTTPSAFQSPVPTPPLPVSSTFLSPLTPPTNTNLITQAYLPIVAYNYPVYMTYGQKGVGDSSFSWMNNGPGSHMVALTYDWYYDWRYYLVPERNSDLKYVRMVWCNEVTAAPLGWPDVYGINHTITETATADFISNRRGRIWLVFNEPDHTSQCGGQLLPNGDPIISSPAATAYYYSMLHDLIKSSDPYAKVYGGGLVWLNTAETRWWWQTFVSTLQSIGALHKLEGVHVHLYPKLSTALTREYTDTNCFYPDCVGDLAQAANTWYSQMHVGLGLGDRPIWITEVGWLGCTEQSSPEWIRDHVMTPFTQWYAGDPSWPYDPQVALNQGYEKAAWFVTTDPYRYSCTWLLSTPGPSGTLTSLGAWWNAFQP